jgi:hypothetical protein
MRKLLLAVGLAAVLVPTPVMAQSGGAVIERGSAEGWGYEWDGDHTLLIYSTMSNFSCGDDTSVPRDALYVGTPAGAWHWRDRGQFFARIYPGTEEDLWETGEPLDFICTANFTAEGILQALYRDNDQTANAPGANVFGHGLEGTLTDLTDTCRSGMVSVHFLVHLRILPAWDGQYPACVYYTPSCVELIALKGPTVRCAGK